MSTSIPGKPTSLCLMSCKNVSLNCHEVTLPHEITGGLNKAGPSGIFSVYSNLQAFIRIRYIKLDSDLFVWLQLDC